MNYFKKYPIYLILRDELPFKENKITPQDLDEVNRLLKIYHDIFPYITNKFSNYGLTIEKGLVAITMTESEYIIKSKDELYNDLQNKFNYSREDIDAVLNIDDNWNINCVNCHNCYKCINCVDCNDCVNCELCFRCNNCKNTINRRTQENLINDQSHFPLIVGETFTPDDSSLIEELKK